MQLTENSKHNSESGNLGSCGFEKKEAFDKISKTAKCIMGVEMSEGQIMDDIEISNKGRLATGFYGRAGGMIPQPKAIAEKAKAMLGGEI
jgi:2-oxoglutarate ferredoxin oxidoreductase subunit alpha